MRDSWHVVFTDRPALTIGDERLARAAVLADLARVAVVVHLQHEGDREVFRAGVQLDEWLAPVWYMHAVIGRDVYSNPVAGKREFIGTQTSEFDEYIQRGATPDAHEWAWNALRVTGPDIGPEVPCLGPWYVVEATATEAPDAYHLVTSW